MTSTTGPSWLERQSDVVMKRPLNEWTFTHFNWLVPTARVAAGPERIPLPVASADLGDLRYKHGTEEYSLADLHRRTHTTAFVVLHRGRIVHESYPGRFAGPRTRMQLFSLSKSVTSMLIGIAVAEGAIGSVKDLVTDYRPDFAGTAWDGNTLADLLDMNSGVGEQEAWDAYDAPIREFERAVISGGDISAIMKRTPRVTVPGERFAYSTFDAQILGWVLEAATGKPISAYASQRLWTRIGAERDAYYALSRSRPRTAINAGGFNATARDLARLGLLMARDGMIGDRQVVPRDWVRKSRGSDLPHLAVGALGVEGSEHYGYANQWWTLGETCFNAFTGLGVHGQFLFVDPAAEMVAVKCSAWPVEEDPELDRETIAALRRIADHLAS
jgi:CubicO group peptidase (beta-lactamase class C family)